MNIAIITDDISHFECIGFLAENLKNFKLTVYHTDLINNWKYIHRNWINYYKKIFNFSINNLENFNEDFYDIIIKLTYEDNIKNHSEKSFDKTIFIFHSDNNDFHCKNSIMLSPTLNNISKNNNFKYILPLFLPKNLPNIEPNKKLEKIILYIGLFETYYFDDDLLKFINELPDYNFLFIGRRKKTDVISHIKKLNLKNVIINLNCDTELLIENILKSKYILIRKYPFQSRRFTGALSLSLSFRKIPILMESMKNSYNISHCVTYSDNKYSNSINEIKNKSDDEYIEQTKNYGIYCDNLLNKNQIEFNEIINNINIKSDDKTE